MKTKMSIQEFRIQTMVETIAKQRNAAMDGLVNAAGEIAERDALIEKVVEKLDAWIAGMRGLTEEELFEMKEFRTLFPTAPVPVSSLSLVPSER